MSRAWKKLIKAGLKPGEFRSGLYLFNTARDVKKIRVSNGQAIVVFSYGNGAVSMPLEAGVYEVDMELLPKGRLPIGVQIVPKKLAKLICKMPSQEIDQILNVALLASTNGGAKQ